MYTPEFKNILTSTLDGLRAEGLYKEERFIASQQYSQVTLKDGRSVINMCANNYLGLANNPEVMEAAKKAIDQWGFGMASVRFICGTQTLHRQLEERLTQFLGTEDTILFPSCFDANGGLFEGLLTADDAIISDSLNHASIIDGVRLCKAKRFRYANNDMADLEAKLQEADAAGARVKLISTDGVFSMDGIIAQLDKIHELAAKYNAIVHFDDCHATGFLGEKGRGTHEYRGLFGHIDITTGTLGKALGGASGGYVSGPKEVVDVLRQKARPYLFSNTLAPAICAATLRTIDLLAESTALRLSRPWSCSPTPRSCGTRSTRTPGTSVPRWRRWALSCCPASTPSSPSCSMTRRSRRSLPAGCLKRACMSSASAIPSSRRVATASARRSPPAIRRKTSISPSAASARSKRKWDCKFT